MKIVQNVLLRQCGGGFSQIAFFKVSVPKIALPDWNSRQYVKTVGFLCKLYKTCFSGHVEDASVKSHFQSFGAKNRSTGLKFTPMRENSRLSMKIVKNVLFTLCGERFGQIAVFNVWKPKIAQRTEFHANTWKQYPFYENCTKRAFQATGSTFWPNRIFQRLGARNRSTGLKFTPIRENSKLSIKIVQNVLFTLCGGRFGQIAFLNVLHPKVALPDWNSRQYVKTVGFLWKFGKTCF